MMEARNLERGLQPHRTLVERALQLETVISPRVVCHARQPVRLALLVALRLVAKPRRPRLRWGATQLLDCVLIGAAP